MRVCKLQQINSFVNQRSWNRTKMHDKKLTAEQLKPDIPKDESADKTEMERAKRISAIVRKILENNAAKNAKLPNEQKEHKIFESMLATEKENSPPQVPLDKLASTMSKLKLEEKQQEVLAPSSPIATASKRKLFTAANIFTFDSDNDDEIEEDPMKADGVFHLLSRAAANPLLIAKELEQINEEFDIKTSLLENDLETTLSAVDQGAPIDLAWAEAKQTEASNEVNKYLATNPFYDDKQLEENTLTELEADAAENFIKRVELRSAVPEWALSTAVFNVDKPKDAVTFGDELPKMPMMGTETLLTISIIKVYSPFQFWFHIADDPRFDLNPMISPFSTFYNEMATKSNWMITPHFMQPGFLCAVFYEYVWRRGRIVHKPVAEAECVAIYLVDYAQCVDVDWKKIYFLNKCFALKPALAVRGTLTDLYPLSSRWPIDVTLEFKRLVFKQERSAFIKQVDEPNGIFFLSVWVKETKTSVSNALIDAKMAGRSRNFSNESFEANFGRRLRYLRERLPTFEMLETRVFPTDMPELEDKLDEIIYSLDFHMEFQPPKLNNPFLNGLEKALANWLLEYEPEEQQWRKLVQERRAELMKKKKDNNNGLDDTC